MRPHQSRGYSRELYLIASLVCCSTVTSINHHAIHTEEVGAFKQHPHSRNGSYPMLRRGSMEVRPIKNEQVISSDFDELNEVLRVLDVPLPDAYLEQNYRGSNLKFWAENIVCSDIEIGDATISYEFVGETGIKFDMLFQEIRGSCDLDWRYRYPTFFTTLKDSGTAEALISRSSFGTGVLMQSTNFETYPPSLSEELYCDVSIKIDKIRFLGGNTVAILNAIEPFLRKNIEESLNKLACEEAEVVNEVINDIVNIFGDFLGNHTEGIPNDRKDILLPESNLKLPEDPSSIVNLSDEELILLTFEWINSMFGSMTEDPSSPHLNGTDLGINTFLRSTILTEGYLDFPGAKLVDDGKIYEGTNIIDAIIEIEEVRLIGLDTLSDFQPLDIVGEYTISNQFKWDYWIIEIDTNIVVSPPDEKEPMMIENVTITTKLHDVEIDMSFLMALDLDELEFGMLLEIASPEEVLSCTASSMYSLEVSGLSANITNIDSPTLSGFKSEGIDHLMTNLTDGIFEIYDTLFINLLPTISETTIRDMINSEIDEILEGNKSCQVYDKTTTASTYVNFFDLFLSEAEALVKGGKGSSPYGDFFRILMGFIEEEFLRANPKTGKLRINEFIGSFTKERTNLTGTLLYPEPFFNLNQSVDAILDGDIELTVYDSRLDGLNSILSPVELAVPVEPQVLNNIFTLAAFNASTKVLFGIYQEEKHLRNELEIAMEIQEISVDLNSLISIVEKSLVEYPLQYITDIDCLLSMISIPDLNNQGIREEGVEPTLAISQLNMLASKVDLSVNCISCTSPEFDHLTTMLEDPKASEDLTRVSNQLLDLLANVLKGPLLQVQIDRMLNEASIKCPIHPNYKSKDRIISYNPILTSGDTENGNGSFFLSFFIVFGCISLFVFAIKWTIRYMRSKNHQDFIKGLSKIEKHELITTQRSNEEKNVELNKLTKSLITSPFIPFPVRILVPLFILGNVALFLSGHFSTGAFVEAEIKIAGEIVSLNEIFSFSIANSILQMWNAGARALAIIVFIFSGIWPYIKLLMTMFLWFSSPLIVSVTTRESTLLLMDTLGKWSFADIFVLVISIVSFRISVQSPQDYSFLPEELYALNLLVLPKLGLYANFLAQIISQLLSHVVIYYHRKAVSNIGESNTISENSVNDVIALRTHSFMISGRQTNACVPIQNCANFLVSGIGSLSLIFVICGSILPSFALEVFGLIGILVEAGQSFESSFQSFNIFSIAAALFKQSRFTDTWGDYIGLGSLSIIMVVTVCFVPIIQISLNLIRWFKPMTTQQRRRIFIITETVAAWQYLEVYIVSIIIASWQLGPISTFMINGYCGSLSGIFAALAYYRMIDGSDAQCFQVVATVQTAAWLLVVGALSASVLNHFVGMAEEQFLNERERATMEADLKPAMEDEILHEQEHSDDEVVHDESIVMPKPQFTNYYGWLFKRTTSTSGSYQESAEKEEDVECS